MSKFRVVQTVKDFTNGGVVLDVRNEENVTVAVVVPGLELLHCNISDWSGCRCLIQETEA